MDKSESKLIKPREEVASELQKRITIGQELLGRHIPSFKELQELENDMWNWHSYNVELAKRSFSPADNEYYQEVRNPTPSPETLLGAVSTDRSLGSQINNIKSEIRDRVKVLQQLVGKLELIPISSEAEPTKAEKLHMILAYMVEHSEKDGQNCFLSEEIKNGLGSKYHIREIEYLGNILIADGFVRDIRTQGGYGICTKDSTFQAYYSKHYLDEDKITDIPTENVRKEISKTIVPPDEIFIVHGHNDGIKIDVARTIEKLGLNAIILHEQPNSGLTIIEKFEKHAKVGFAVVLLTDDDLGRSKNSKDDLPRARQNVVLEMGYFIGALGRQKVCILYTPGVELPSDVSGILYTRIDDEGNWRIKLAKELIEAGFSVDIHGII